MLMHRYMNLQRLVRNQINPMRCVWVYVCERELWEQISMVIALIIRECFVVIDLSISRRFQVSFELGIPVMWQHSTVHIVHSDFNCFAAEFEGNSGVFFIIDIVKRIWLWRFNGSFQLYALRIWKRRNSKIWAEEFSRELRRTWAAKKDLCRAA